MMYPDWVVNYSISFASFLQTFLQCVHMLGRELVSFSLVQCPAAALANNSLSYDRWHNGEVNTAT